MLTLRVSTQVIEHARAIAAVVGFPHGRVRVIGAYMGGGFGGKEDMTVEPYLALLVWKTRRPVRMVWTRQESLQARQNGTRSRCAIAPVRPAAGGSSRRTSRSSAMPAPIRCSPRACCSRAAAHSIGPYRCDDVRAASLAVFTNTVPNSAFRGFGAMQVVLGHELQMDRIAEVTGLDRVEVRRRNFARRGDLRPSRERFDTEIGVSDCLDAVLEAMGPPRPPRPGIRIGRGIACNAHPYGRNVFMNDHASAWIGFERDGTLVIRAGVTDLGAGQAASLADIACEILGSTVPTTAVHIGDSALTPLVGGTFATRQLYMSGNAVEKVARELRAKLEPVAAELLGARPGRAHVGRRRRARRAARAHAAPRRAGRVRRVARRDAVQHSHSTPRRAEFDAERHRHRPHGARLHVRRPRAPTSRWTPRPARSGRRLRRLPRRRPAIDVQRVEGQIEGAVAQGIGYALSEEIESSARASAPRRCSPTT